MRLTGMILGLALWAGHAAAQDNAAIEGVIGNQLDAFNARNVEEAWQYASPTIQSMFGNAGNFGMMVERGYPMVWTNTVTDYLELQDRGGLLIQRVLISDAQGVPHVLEYHMIETAEGWRINGVSILPAPEVGA